MKKTFKLAPEGAGFMYTYAATSKKNSVFRMSAHLNQKIDLEIFNRAVKNSYERYPQFFVRIHQTFFTRKYQGIHKSEVNFDKMILTKEEKVCKHFDIFDKTLPLVRFICEQNTISAECFHGIADAPAFFEFLSYVLENYVCLLGGESVVRKQTKQEFELETKDIFKDLLQEKHSTKAKITNSNYNFSKQMKGQNYSITRIKFDTKELLAASKKEQMNLGAFLISGYMYTMLKLKKRGSKKDITFVIPVGIRKFYNCKTTRNAALFLEVKQPHNDASLQEVMTSVKDQMVNKGTKEHMAAVANESVKFTYWFIIKCVPNFIKRRIIGVISHVSENKRYTACVSNIGKLELSTGVQELVENISFSVPKLAKSGFVTTISSYGDTTTFELGTTGDGEFIIEKLVQLYKTKLEKVQVEVYKYDF